MATGIKLAFYLINELGIASYFTAWVAKTNFRTIAPTGIQCYYRLICICFRKNKIYIPWLLTVDLSEIMYNSSRMNRNRLSWQGIFNCGFPHILLLHRRVLTLFHSIRGYSGRLVSLDCKVQTFRLCRYIFAELASVKHLSLLQVLMCFETICRCWLFWLTEFERTNLSGF